MDGAWKLADSAMCDLAALVAKPCSGDAGSAPRPPSGWNDPATVDASARAAFAALANPAATVEQRLAAVAEGPSVRAAVETGLAADREWQRRFAR